MNPRRATSLAVVLGLGLGCAGGRPPPTGRPGGLDAAAAREVLVGFAARLEAGDHEGAVALLAARWRARTSGPRLARDHAAAGPAAREAVARARRAGPRAPVVLEPGRAVVSLGEGRRAVLVAEGDGWRVDALE